MSLTMGHLKGNIIPVPLLFPQHVDEICGHVLWRSLTSRVTKLAQLAPSLAYSPISQTPERVSIDKVGGQA